jgi:hypothetical protein
MQQMHLYICKYTYRPKDHSPNDNPDLELELIAGEYLFVLDVLDDDGFYNGQTLVDAKRGLVPSNFVEKVQNLTKDSYQQILTRCEYCPLSLAISVSTSIQYVHMYIVVHFVYSCLCQAWNGRVRLDDIRSFV